ncbi:CRISPR-associated endonuclease Cas2 [Desulfovibrionales bacterium]
MEEHLYIVSYDIRNSRRWRKVFTIMKGYGEWLQFSIFQCQLSKMRLIRMRGALEQEIKHGEDHVLIMDMGVASNIKPKIQSLGLAFKPVTTDSVIV